MDEKHFESLYPPGARFAETEKVLSHIKGGNFCQLVGIPGAGKGILLACLAYNRTLRTVHLKENEKWHHFVFIDFSTIRRKPLIDAYKLIFLTLVDSIQARTWTTEYNVIHPFFEAALRTGDEIIILQRLKKALEYLCLEKELTVVFLFEHFQSYLPSLTGEFFAQLASLKARLAYRFSVVFSLTRPLEELVEHEMYKDVYPLLAGHSVYMKLYDVPSVTFRLSYLEKTLGITVSSGEKQHLLEATAGHSKMTKVASEEVLTHTPPQKQLADFLQKNTAVRNVSYEIWYSLTPEEQNLLKKLSIASSRHPELDSGLDSGESILQRSHRDSGSVQNQIPDQVRNDKTQHDKNITSYLEAVHILKDGQLSIPLFEDFVRYRAEHLSDEKIVYRAETQDILKGEAVLTGKLTSAEFKLLLFLIKYEGQVVGREALIEAVWHDSATTEGVTDQAVDQLLFRLRRKIEDNPNSPTHIITVKGRGVRFSP